MVECLHSVCFEVEDVRDELGHLCRVVSNDLHRFGKKPPLELHSAIRAPLASCRYSLDELVISINQCERLWLHHCAHHPYRQAGVFEHTVEVHTWDWCQVQLDLCFGFDSEIGHHQFDSLRSEQRRFCVFAEVQHRSLRLHVQ